MHAPGEAVDGAGGGHGTAGEPAGDRVVVAAFDFDGTLTDGGSVWRFLSAMRGRRAVVEAGMRVPHLLGRAVVLGGEANSEAKEALFVRLLAGLDATDVARRAAEFGRAHYRRRARPEIAERLRRHLDAGHHVVVVSASPELYLRPVAELLGAEAVVGTRLEVGPDGRLTGRYDGGNCRGAEKRRRLAEWMSTSLGSAGDGPARPFVWAYGNSDGDRSLLGAADVGVDVGRLGRLGKLRRFPRLVDLGPSVDAPPAGARRR